MIPSTAQRVPQHTTDYVNQQIREQTRQNVERVAAQGPVAIDRRLRDRGSPCWWTAGSP